MKKMTKKEMYEVIKAVVVGREVEVSEEDILAFCDKEIENLDKKATKAKERAAGKKAEGDALREEVFSHVTGEWQTADAITALVVGEDITKAKVVARLTQLVKAGMVEKEQQKVGDAKLMCYRVVSAE